MGERLEMGLDMYLYTNSKELAGKLKKDEGIVDYAKRQGCIAYWRKANHIHKWFVDNAQDGIDNCDLHEVTIEMLEDLKKACDKVLDSCPLVEGEVCVGMTYQGDATWKKDMAKGRVLSNPHIAAEVLPTTDGFFFGSTDYDEYYYYDTKYTRDRLEEVLSLIEGDHMVGEPDWVLTFTYRSSW